MIKKFLLGLIWFILGAGTTLFLLFFLLKKDVMLSDESLIMYTGYTNRIYVKNYDGSCQWLSKDSKIAEVSEGVIIAKKSGETDIVCITDEGEEYICNVMVYDSISGEYLERANKEVQWLSKLQLSNGSYSCYELEENMPARVNPYFGSYVALAILTNDHSYEKSEDIEAFIKWYFLHMNTSEDVNGLVGTIYDYEVRIEDGYVVSETTTKEYDSTDSYSALFLTVLNTYYEKYGDSKLIEKEKKKVDMLVEILLSNDGDYYTESKIGSEIKYLMNNMEVYQGLKNAMNLYEALWKEDEKANKLKVAIKGFEENFKASWIGEEYYYPVLNGKNQSFYGEVIEWDKLYEYALPQLFPIIFDMADSNDEFNMNLYSEFCNWWDWTQMNYRNESEANQTWSLIAYAALKIKDYESANRFIECYDRTIIDRGFPFYSGDSVWYVLTCEKAYEAYAEMERKGILLPCYQK